MYDTNLPDKNDNREYDYTSTPEENRAEYATVVSLVQPGSKVVDLGCGNGSLMQLLAKEKNTTCTGVELAVSGADICRKKGFETLQRTIDAPLPFADNSFDYAICNVTMQMVQYPEVLLHEMKRVATYQVISFPNFAFYKNRLQLLFGGRMPKKLLYGYTWYNTGHIHQFSIKDFRELVTKTGGLELLQQCSANKKGLFNLPARVCPNLFEILPVFLLRKTNEHA
jgi:methionine biosynthesis protein MetW